jgi:predicted small lipoprotein YifL
MADLIPRVGYTAGQTNQGVWQAMQRVSLIFVLVLSVGNLSGCGQKGPLYRDAPAQEVPDRLDATAGQASDSRHGSS